MRSPTRHPTRSRVAASLAAVVALVVTALVVTAGAPAVAHAGPPPPGDASRRGEVLWAEPVRTFDADQARATLVAGGFDAGQVRNGVATYRLVYRTIDPHGAPTTASGLLAVPATTTPALRLVSFAHGTTSYRSDAPSTVAPDDLAAAPALAYAAAGLAAAAPDYLGLGFGPGTHPYFDIASETSASLDLLRAVRNFVPTLGRSVRPEVDVTGFSQGASAALGLARALQEGADRHLRVHAVAPVSGAYDFRGAELPAMLRGEVAGPLAVAYASYLLVATNRLHPVYRDPSEIFRAPWATRVETLFGGDVPGAEMLQALPSSLDALLTPRGLALLAHPSGGLADALATIDGTCSWRPGVPVRLYDATGDEQAVTANTASCAQSFAAHGASTPVVDLGPVDAGGSRHLGSSVAGTAATLAWFRTLDD